MREDCKRDNRKTFLPKAIYSGYSTTLAKAGMYIQYDDGMGTQHGRILSFVTTTGGKDKGKRYIEVAALLGNLDNICIRWIDRESVQLCTTKSPLSELLILCGDLEALDAYAKRY